MIQIILIVFNCHGFCETWFVFFLRNMTWPGNVTCRADMHFYKINCWFTLNLSKKDQWTKNTGPIDTGPIGQDQKHWTNRYWTNRAGRNALDQSILDQSGRPQLFFDVIYHFRSQSSKPNWEHMKIFNPTRKFKTQLNKLK